MDSNLILFRVPKLYENMDEATIGKWLIEEGQSVAVGDELVEFVTDKTTELYQSPYEGTLLKCFCDEKSTIPVGYIIAAIGAEGSDIPDVSAENEALIKDSDPLKDLDLSLNKPGEQTAGTAAPASKRPRIAPAARALAKRNGIDINELAEHFGSKMIHKQDVEAYLKEKGND